ncbi:MAG TPA: hypothetical protein VKF38_01170 [Anaerolineaceae bacterium]|nr:hypothetical protein [Anaerolineaceae bacterium]
MAQIETVRQAKTIYQRKLLASQNVVGLGTAYKMVAGQATRELCLATLVTKKVSSAVLAPEDKIPPKIGGVYTDVIEVGHLVAQASQTTRCRPAVPGVSIGHYKITAGTFGCVVRDRQSNARMILSNNHVLANSNAALVGDPILQPGAIDGGKQGDDTVGFLSRFHPITFGDPPQPTDWQNTVLQFVQQLGLANLLSSLGLQNLLGSLGIHQPTNNVIDCAVARPVNDTIIGDDILEIGKISGTLPASLGLLVRKSGRSTGLTTGSVIVVDATVSVDYEAGQSAHFDNQILTSPMSKPGDSGSLLVAANTQQAVGLLFAGSDQTTIYNPIQAVLDSLEVTL